MKESPIEKCEESLKAIYSNMKYPKQIGAMPEEKWRKFLETHLKDNGDLYVPEQVLKIIEQLAVKNNIDSALKIYDSMEISLTDFDEVTEIVKDNFPVMGQRSQELLGKTYNEFLVRANSQAASERLTLKNKKQIYAIEGEQYENSIVQTATIEECEESLKEIYSDMKYPKQIGAMPEVKWRKFLETHLKDNGDLYVPEQVLKIIEQLAVKNNIDGALKIYDSMEISLTDFDEVTEIIRDNFPVMGQKSQELLGGTYNEFLVRANSEASRERRIHLLSKEKTQILPSQAVKNALQIGTTSEKVNKAHNIEITEQHLGKNNEGVTKND